MTTCKSCDGTYEYVFGLKSEKVKCTLNLYKHENCFTVRILSNDCNLIFTEILIEKKNPLFDDKSFYIMGNKIFTVEDSSTSRFNDIKKLFESGFNVQNYINYSGNNYAGETKDDLPNGKGILYYGRTNKIMAKSNFVDGKLDGQSILYSKDQNIEIICDDIVNMKPVQYVTILFKNINKEIQVDMIDFAVKHKTEIYLVEMDKYIETLAMYAIMNDNYIFEPHKFLFLNKKPEQQYEEMFEILNDNKNLLIRYTANVNNTFKIIRYLMILYFPFFLYLLCNVK
jgi:hypothetical protein